MGILDSWFKPQYNNHRPGTKGAAPIGTPTVGAKTRTSPTITTRMGAPTPAMTRTASQSAGVLSMPSGRYGSKAPQQTNSSYTGPGSDLFSQMYGLSYAANADKFAALQAEREAAMREHQASLKGLALDREGLGSDYMFGMADAGIDTRGRDIQLENMPLWRQFIDQQKVLAMQRAGTAKSRLDQQDELTNKMRELEVGGFGRQREGVRSDFSRMIEDMNSGAVAMGGAYANMDRITARGTEDLGRAEEDITQQDQTSYFQRQDELRGSQKERERINWDVMGQMTSYDEELAKINERESLLRLEAERAGISQAKLKKDYELALKRMNLDKSISAGRLAEMVNSSNAQEQALARQILAQAQMLAKAGKTR